MRYAAGVAVVAVAVAAADARAAAPTPVLLVSGQTRLTAEPPLLPDLRLQETRWRGRIRSSERVLVSVDGSGRAVAVRVLQRLVVGGKGDYVFAVPAPVRDVRAGPGSESEPGLRTDLVLWQGFSAGGRVLVADATLDAARAGRALPLRARLERHGDAYRLRVENATGVDAVAATGTGRPAELRRILAQAGSLQPGGKVYATIATGSSGRPVHVEAPFRVRGALVFPAGALAHAQVRGARVVGNEVRFSSLLGGGSPLALDVEVRGVRAEPRLQLRAVPEIPSALLHAPPGIDGRRLLALTAETLLRAARVVQYRTFLENPDPSGSVSIVYEYRTAPKASAAPAAPGGGDDGSAWRPLLVGVGLALLAAVLVVAWAHA